NHELKSYDSHLIEKPQIIVTNKMDMPNSEEKLNKFKEQLPPNTEVIDISTYTKTNIDKLLYKIADALADIPYEPIEEEKVTIRYEEKEKPFVISRSDDGAFVLSGPEIERIFHATDFEYDESVQRFSRRVRHLGIDRDRKSVV